MIQTLRKTKTPKSTQKIIIKSAVKKTLKRGLNLKDKSMHMIDKVNLGFKRIILKL